MQTETENREKNSTLSWIAENTILAIVIYLLWNTAIIKPFKTLVVFLHETYHAISAIATGGHVRNIEVTAYESGVTFVSGGIPIIVYSAGYLGTAFTGALMIATGRAKKLKRYFPMIIGLLLITSTLLFVRNRYGFLFGIITGSTFIFLFIKQFFFLKYITDFVGMMCVVYTIYDFKDFINTKTNDAVLLSRVTGIPTVIIYSTWIVISVAMFFLAFRFAYKHTKKESKDSQEFPHPHI